MKAVILDADTLGSGDVDLSRITDLPLQWAVYDRTDAGQVAERMAGAEVVLTNKAPIGAVELDGAPGLRYIGVLATGTNVVDLEEAAARGVVVSNVTGYGTGSVVQHTWALILALTTHLPDYNVAALDGRWAASHNFCLLDFPVTELAGKTLAIVGYGQLGKAVAGVGHAFGMQVKVAALPWRHGGGGGRVPFDQLLREADVLTLHCPLTEETRGLIGRRQLAMMKSSALLINCARGGLVDEQALAEALEDGEIAGAGVDVLSEEPPVNGNPLLNPDLPNLIVTPHSAWVAKEARQRLIDQVADNLREFLAGNPVNVVNRK
ncbi:MAG: D-2-hydroxyacid dehydrogenase [Porticoccaceae bacterium]